MEKVRLRAIVHGRVQGVYFRDFTRTWARRLGVVGYIRNLPDGTVEVVAEGDTERLERLLDHLKIGPEAARVERVDTDWGPSQRGFESFEIKHG